MNLFFFNFELEAEVPIFHTKKLLFRTASPIIADSSFCGKCEKTICSAADISVVQCAKPRHTPLKTGGFRLTEAGKYKENVFL